jgi:hypothetical protein
MPLETMQLLAVIVPLRVSGTVTAIGAHGSAVTVMLVPRVSVVVAKPAPLPCAVTVMVATPGLTAVTTPAADTVATVVALDEYVTFTVAPAGLTGVATSGTVAPTVIEAVAGVSVKPVSAGGSAATVTVAVAVCPVIVAEPADTPVTTHDATFAATVAIEVFEDEHDANVGVGEPPEMLTANDVLAPTFTVAVVGAMEMDTAGGGGGGCTKPSPPPPPHPTTATTPSHSEERVIDSRVRRERRVVIGGIQG